MNLALFDFDGTITTREMFGDFVRHAVSRPRRLAGNFIFAPLIIGYKAGWVTGNTIRASVVRFGFRGVPHATVSELAAQFCEIAVPGVLREVAMRRILWHKERGDKVVVVSGGLDIYLSHWCEKHGLELVCSRLESRDGVLTGRYREAQCIGEEKRRRVSEAYDLNTYEHIYAYGDTKDDMEMLEMAQTRFFRWKEMGR
ncbi:HAD superfamily hydrolase (TIGR01490 family) [Luteibacter sp. Sphag1AF]|uniref:HAD family hydrolase n=1 Tax=Luteibacter sp. Sphag1AF TaxID=2587031 RepID=UPI00160939DF|nr:HAD family hydrolase [Luteibacter sp. Sphag1AF]MBB3228873.1 HAD superfamily hydrolase (TIGR01490 family) [Luteibacter sp. Sphag1AF]